MTNLTEQWKNGKLKAGWYYVNDGQIDYKYSKHSSVDFFVTPNEDIKEVLATVPSYDYFVELTEKVKENQQLKDVISKMCMELVDPDDNMSNGLAEYFNQDLLLKIHEVLK